VFENRVLWGILESKRKAVTGWLRKLHNEELHDKYYSDDQIKKDGVGVGFMWHVLDGREMHATFWWENLKERNH
jgi:hypothetical protein